MTDSTPDAYISAVQASFDTAADARARNLLRALVRHLHEFVQETRLSTDEWRSSIDFLTDTGHWCTDTRQEFILLSDVLGVSSLVETLNGQNVGTESTVLGPFHMTESPEREVGDSIDEIEGGRSCVVSGRVLGTDGIPLPGATLDVWQCSSDGFYDVQQPGDQPAGNGRGLFKADDQGCFWFRTVVPSHYPIPTDGPVGRLLRAAGRHPYRPAHVHFIAGAPGYERVTTHAFVAGSPYLDSDAVFAVKDSLVVEFVETFDQEDAARFGVPVPFRHARLDLVLKSC